jgi:MscS family membrane protein
LALYVPNSVFITVSIENESRAKNRSIRQIISMQYSDITKVPFILTEIEAMLKAHEAIDQKQQAYVVMNKFSPLTLDCLLSCYTKTTDYVTFLKVQQDILVKITAILQQQDAEIVLPAIITTLPH